jgi:membrane protein involved in colicin uptake
MDERCFPKLAKLMADTAKQLEGDRQAELVRREAELRRKAEEEARRQAIEAEAAEREAQIKHEAAAKREAASKKAAERYRETAEAEGRAAQAEAQARQEAARKAEIEAAREAARPQNKVLKAYSAYLMVKWCHDWREGHWVQYINDVELRRAEAAVKAIVTKLQREDPSMSLDQLWQRAEEAAGQPINDISCHAWYRDLMAMSPVPAIQVQRPQ